ncbi:MAG: cell division ATP-binding protein FtsE [Alphaproteobacteria bacterium]|nr:MAG: cell division ATP-binding protein FtsE [Alphaproteobacteria bacterium]
MIKLSHIGLRYDGGPEVLTDISLTLEQGSFHYLSGESGSGKTSLMRLLSIAKLPSRGDVTMFGEDVISLTRINRAHLRQQIGVIFQDFRLLSHLSLYDNIALPLRLSNHPEHKIKSAVKDIANWIGLGDYLKTKPLFLSGGQQQRAAIARAVITKPKFLLADEPTGNLDDDMGQKIMVLFEELNKSGTSVVLATHNKILMKTFKHPVLTLKNGELVK